MSVERKRLESMLSPAAALVQEADFGLPEQSSLVLILRRRSVNGSVLGSMPKQSAYVFSSNSMARIETWIGNGAPADYSPTRLR